ncbi:lachesin isoform X2 [Eurytemora carolleeae]|uniref:lachesin isoform X2 n=1 Tax=Eurytemora carolleeae TaxID=1294199 RepID=UPI000C79144F|nr:lachesin isoform X2 [Eurytemora carolleeae]|eukprot:XP_023341591.1 lachesin-like isoform X2 [Eurytemora affinis]
MKGFVFENQAMSINLLLTTLLSGATGFEGGYHKQLYPRISTNTSVYEKAVGEEVTLWCDPQDVGSFVVLWRKNDHMILTAGDMIVKPDPRLSLVEKNLRIKSLEAGDAGTYTCYVSTNGPEVSVSHNLHILVPASVRAEPSDGNYVVKKDRRVELKCSASGNPLPEVEWTKKGGRLPGDEMKIFGETLVIQSIAKNDRGVYICTAMNGVGHSAEAEINLQVLYPPEIELSTNKVHSGESKEAHLTCIVKGNPNPTVRWYKETSLLSESSSVSFANSNDRHTLILSIRSGLDFGNYSCVAENSMGTFKKHIEVHGRPTSPVFRSEPNTNQPQMYLLSWSVDSYSPIEEHRLLYRKIKPYHGPLDANYPMGEGDWTNVIIPGEPGHQGFNHLKFYQISGLVEDAEYECLVQARNRFGWSEPSRLFTFFTSRPAPVAHDLEWKRVLSNGMRIYYPSILLQALAFVIMAFGRH